MMNYLQICVREKFQAKAHFCVAGPYRTVTTWRFRPGIKLRPKLGPQNRYQFQFIYYKSLSYTCHFLILDMNIHKNDNTGGRDKVEFFKVNKHFWRTFLSWNWRLRFMTTENELSVKVDWKLHLRSTGKLETKIFCRN